MTAIAASSMGTQGFPADLVLGPSAFDGDDELADLVAQRVLAIALRRGFPLHTAVAFNALHHTYDWDDSDDSDSGHYAPTALDVLTDPKIAIGATHAPQDTVPVGALIWVAAGNADAIWVEVVGKDGRPGTSSDGTLAAASSGGPSDLILNEAWCIDPHLFGHDPRNEARLSRWTRDDSAGHHLVSVTARYPSTAAANESDITFFVRWMLDHAAGALASGPLGQSLLERPDPTTVEGRDVLGGALVATLAAIEEALGRCDALRRWGDYWVPTTWLDQVDERPNLPFGRHDLDGLLTSLARAGRGQATAWATLGPRLDDLAATFVQTAALRGSDHNAPADPLAGTAWLRHVAVTSRWIGDELVRRGGIVPVGATTRYVRCDDRWPFGGVWMSSKVPGQRSPLWGLLPDEPAWLGHGGDDAVAALLRPHDDDTGTVGWDEDDASADDVDTDDIDGDDDVDTDDFDGDGDGDDAAAAAAPPHDEPSPDRDPTADDGEAATEGGRDTAETFEVDDSFIEATITLRARDIEHGSMQLPDRFNAFVEAIRRGQPVHVKLTHHGLLDDDQRVQTLSEHDGSTVGPLDWPIDFASGIRLHLAAVANLPTIYASTRVVVTAEGTGFLTEAASSTTRDRDRLTLAALAVDALRRCGRATYGSRRATVGQITEALFGADPPAVLVHVVGGALDELVERRRLAMVGSEYEISDHASDPTIERLRPAGRPMPTPRPEDIRAHHVLGFLRQLPETWRASADKRDEYRRLTGTSLPDGFTWVSAHVRGVRFDAWRYALIGAETPDGPLSAARTEQLLEERFSR